jgi:hypothetical protein
MSDRQLATRVVESLRQGLPPQRGIRKYAVGYERLLDGVAKRHLSGIEERGIIRFVSGSWGSGKTHFFRLLREQAFEQGCLVAGVELNVNEAPLNKFEQVFHSIIQKVQSPGYYAGDVPPTAVPFGAVLGEALVFLATGNHEQPQQISHEDYTRACERLMACQAIDIDFRKIVQKYWETYLPESPDLAVIDQKRAELLQWFSGDGTAGQWRKQGINKVVDRSNAKLMLESLAAFARLVGYRGIVILFDEAEMSFSVMKKSSLKEAHNNLLHLINNVDQIPGLFLIYATTPDFYTDPRHGIVVYGALAGRVGKPADRPPKALDTVWNIDAVDFDLANYQAAAKKIRDIYTEAYPEAKDTSPADSALDGFVADLYEEHPQLAQVRFWRVLITATVRALDNALDGEAVPTPQLYHDVMESLRES